MKISVIIPVFNEEKFILQTLEEVNKQKNNFNLEIIIIDDFSTDNSKKIKKKILIYSTNLLKMKKIMVKEKV